MKKFFGGMVGLAASLALMSGSALAQETPPIVINADGPNVRDSVAGTSSTSSRPPGSSNDGGTVTLGDIDPGIGTVIIQAEPGPTTTSGRTPSGGSPAPAAAPEPAPTDGGGSERAVATAEDQDADNYPDASEAAAGLDPTNPDTDGDGAADGDEVNIYGTDPTAFDTDGDGLGDGEELFWTNTDPLVADAASSSQTAGFAPRSGERPVASGTGSDGQSCGDYADWYAAQTAFEASPTALGTLDPDGDGIACESMMEN